jgi:general secretion pathway protein G
VPSRPRSGFTLIEILVVIAVISILASLVSPMVFRNVGDARMSTAEAQIEILSLALDAFRLDVGRYPTTEEGLHVLRDIAPQDSLPGWRGPYLRREVPLDPWDRPYVYVSPGNANPDLYDLLTLGRDGDAGGDGEDADVESWR